MHAPDDDRIEETLVEMTYAWADIEREIKRDSQAWDEENLHAAITKAFRVEACEDANSFRDPSTVYEIAFDAEDEAARSAARIVRDRSRDVASAIKRIVQVYDQPTFHSLRHSHGSALIASGWDLEEVSARLGHRDVTVTARIYVHAYESAKRSAARSSRLEAMYGDQRVSAPIRSARSAQPRIAASQPHWTG